MQLPKFFEFKEAERKIKSEWKISDIYKYTPGNDEFSIDTPPPTVSGTLHMGHVFSYVQADIIARYNRMCGKSVFYPIGFDDNGLPTERLVEKKTSKKVGINCTRKEFKELCEKVVDESESEFEELFRGIGMSFDWSLKYQTVSKKTERLALESFADLYKKGLIYLKDAPVFWDCEDKTALAQADLEDKEIESAEYYIPFTCAASNRRIEIMTTRPELIPACVAVLYHPDDARFTGIKSVKTPIFSEEVPFIADDTVKIEKGTGVVMCCSYGDWTDVEWIKKHNLEPKLLVKENGEIAHEFYKNEETGRYLRTVNARMKIVEALKSNGLVLKENKIVHAVKCAERSGKPIEIIHQRQMYIRVLPFKDFLLKCAMELDFKPNYMQARLENWITGLSQDWCISRNRFFGIEIPYYIACQDGKEYEIICPHGIFSDERFSQVIETETGYSALYKGDIIELNGKTINLEFRYVFDTWCTSAITPQIAKNTLDSKNLPFSLRPQAHEIIRTWTFYTLLKSILHSCILTNDVREFTEIASFEGKRYAIANEILSKGQHLPWRTVGLSGWCLASDKTKMSKSKGNAMDPKTLLTTYGADVIRFWCSNTSLGTDSAFSEERLDAGRKFVTKLWNVTKFVLQHGSIDKVNYQSITNEIDLWLIYELKNTVTEYKKCLNDMEYFHARKALDNFFWNILCDNYLEIVKNRFYGPDAFIYKDKHLTDEEKTKIISEQTSCINTIFTVVEGMLKLYAPYCPFVCNTIYDIIFGEGQKLHKIGSILEFERNIGYIGTNKNDNAEEWLDIITEYRKAQTEKTCDLFQEKYKEKIENMPSDIKFFCAQT